MACMPEDNRDMQDGRQAHQAIHPAGSPCRLQPADQGFQRGGAPVVAQGRLPCTPLGQLSSHIRPTLHQGSS